MDHIGLVVFILFVFQFANCDGLHYNYVTCGSVIKLMHTSHKARLHSHEVQYGSGSGQQSVTGNSEMDDVNSHWMVKGTPDKMCRRGEPVECGQAIRLEHLSTKRNLHSHLFTAPLSRGQEVSAFGVDGEGDTGDVWTVMCSGDYWPREENMMLKHVDTHMYLAISGHTFGQPIPGQLEVLAITSPDSQAQWQVREGIFIKPSEIPHHNHVHTEL